MEELTQKEPAVRVNIGHNYKSEISRELTIRAETPELALKLLKETWEELKKIQ